MAQPGSLAPPDSRVSVSHVVADPVWSLRRWSVEVDLGVCRGTIPAQSAADWLALLMPDRVDLFEIVPRMCGLEFEDQVIAALIAERLEPAEVKRAALTVISSVTGRPWWFAMRLIKTAVASWEIVGGELAFRGVDADKLSISAWLDAVLLICLRGLESAKVTMFMSQLEIPPPEELEDGEESEDMMISADQFLTMAAG